MDIKWREIQAIRRLQHQPAQDRRHALQAPTWQRQAVKQKKRPTTRGRKPGTIDEFA